MRFDARIPIIFVIVGLTVMAMRQIETRTDRPDPMDGNPSYGQFS